MADVRDPNTPITFFRGETYDGCPFVISVIGGSTAGDPGEASGVIRTHDGARLRIPTLTAAAGCSLRHELTLYNAGELHEALKAAMAIN